MYLYERCVYWNAELLDDSLCRNKNLFCALPDIQFRPLEESRAIMDYGRQLASYIYQHTKRMLNMVEFGQPYKNKKH